ncbi:Lsr2 family protein [Actinoallomurus purpureus]|uniref:histone-like nucleoid-structuring protein Lsr2 n=1 Tax=Actinoallomurus purpureus TaxID=478114 RepID=UPI002091EA8D|nr:Lsr2 family protein [Actinoallomurus purpureus]MCO6003411.1 Lsr2 family protein [Actinoallomurus purpureus]
MRVTDCRTLVLSYPRQSKLRKEHLVATKVVMVDDLDGHDGEDVAKRDFEVSGVTYTIDLGDENFKRLEELLETLAPYIERAVKVRPAGRARKSAGDTAPRLRGHSNSDVREWAVAEGIEVSERGKIADEVYEKFIAVHPDAKPEE